jgi:uracil-DNA glycosylase
MHTEKLNWELFKDLIHESWHKDLQPFIESKECYDIYQFLKSEPKNSVIPKSDLLWRPFLYTQKDKFKVMFIGLSPYHTRSHNKDFADGLCFSTELQKEPPSLSLILDAVFDDLGEEGKRELSLKRWAEEGVLLMNAALTTTYLKAGNHLDLWKPFWEYFYREVLSKQNGLIIVYFGKEASRLQKYETPFIHYGFPLNHPAFYARMGEPFEHNKVFTKINKILRENNGEGCQINWISKTKTEN